jgi:hypothetical protein
MSTQLTPANGKRPAVLAEARCDDELHPAWREFLCFCARLQHGEIERLKIQDGLPVLAEVTTRKVKFT